MTSLQVYRHDCTTVFDICQAADNKTQTVQTITEPHMPLIPLRQITESVTWDLSCKYCIILYFQCSGNTVNNTDCIIIVKMVVTPKYQHSVVSFMKYTIQFIQYSKWKVSMGQDFLFLPVPCPSNEQSYLTVFDATINSE